MIYFLSATTESPADYPYARSCSLILILIENKWYYPVARGEFSTETGHTLLKSTEESALLIELVDLAISKREYQATPPSPHD
ncbi:hypothetical protein SAMN05444955_103164 [Lihuaxuella thermophila]|uniref:Uncharacterized protein n=1 Tax=Lihuaxuella thermophila TaxID=1173111 RepID=A0A1H8C9G2_9BACL|nr:hypothetical protein SAMN05444955_103164 [Lihuaxuella thermophila]